MNELTKIYPLIPPPLQKSSGKLACTTREGGADKQGGYVRNLQYNSPDLYQLALDAPRKSKAEIRWHPLDVSSISVVSPLDQKVMITVRNKLRNLPPMSFGEAKQIRRKLHKSEAGADRRGVLPGCR